MKDLGPSLRSYLISSMISNRMGARMQVGGRMVCSSSRFSLNHRFQKGQLFLCFSGQYVRINLNCVKKSVYQACKEFSLFVGFT